MCYSYFIFNLPYLTAMRTLSFITTCTNRKRIVPVRKLTARAMPKGSARSLAREWTRRISRANPVATAKELYQGRAFSEARKLAEVAGVPFYIISAGLGLFCADKQIPSYSLTVSAGSTDAIQNRCTDGAFSAATWWRMLTVRFGLQYPLTQLIAGSKGKLWLLALPISYFELVADDLDQLSDAQLERIRIIGPQADKAAHRVLEACLLDVDDRLNGPDSPLPGTQTDFAQRAARFVYDAVIRANPAGEVLAHRRAISRRLSAMRPAKRYKRQLMSDEGIMAKIKALWDVADGRSGRMLRVLRDQENIACEQGRLKNLFRLVQEEFNS